MGWFDEQVKQRIEFDDKEFDKALYGIADAVANEKLSKLLENNKDNTINAIDEILKNYGFGEGSVSSFEYDNINEQIDSMCRPYGIMHREVILSDEWYRDAFCSYLAVNKRNGELVALLPSSFSGTFKYFDIDSGKYERVNRKNKGDFEGTAIVFYKPLPLRKLKIKDIFEFGMSFWSVLDIMLPVFLMLLTTILGLLVPKLNHFLMNEVFYLKSSPYLFATGFFLICIAISRLFSNSINSLISANNETKTNLSLESAMMMRCLLLPMDFYKKYSSGDLMQRISYANSSCNILISLIFGGGLNAILSLVYISQMFKYAKDLVGTAFLMLGISLLYTIIISIGSVKYRKAVLDAETKENAICYELINGVQKIKLSGSEKRAFARWSEKYARLVNTQLNQPFIYRMSSFISIAISLLGIILMYSRAIESGIGLADYYAFSSSYAMVSGSITVFFSFAEMISDFSSVKSMIEPILDAEPEVSTGRKLVNKVSGSIELSNVFFSYSDSMPLILDNLSLKINAGQYVAIVGKTGCGKSTLMRLMLGFEKPKKGAVYYDGKDLNTLDLQSLRRRIGTVMQEGKLFQGDIYSNIVVSAPYLDLDAAWRAAEMSGFADDIRNMPMGMNTLISEGTGGISGGQKQRLLIARAIASNPSILFFDEATSALDNISQKIVSDSLDALHCTRIVIAHRLSTIKNCDRIIFLDNGRIAEDGTYDELISRNGLFAELVRRQQLDEK